ncbi:MAG: hypothetical protein AAF587_45125, partial [Bacteroidota bacterium]
MNIAPNLDNDDRIVDILYDSPPESDPDPVVPTKLIQVRYDSPLSRFFRFSEPVQFDGFDYYSIESVVTMACFAQHNMMDLQSQIYQLPVFNGDPSTLPSWRDSFFAVRNVKLTTQW